MKLSTKIIISIISIILFYVLFAFYSDLQHIAKDYSKINIFYLFPILCLLVFSMFLRSLVQKFFLRTIGIHLSIKQNFQLFISGLSMIITPGGAGQLIKSHFMEQKYGYPTAKTLPIVIAERFHDLLAAFFITVITSLLFYSATSILAAALSLMILSLLLLILKNKLPKIILSNIQKIKFLSNFTSQTSEFSNSVLLLFQNRIIIRAGFYVILITLLEGFIVYLGFLAFDLNLGYLQSIQVYYASIIFGAISFIPGGAGITEGSMTGLLMHKNIDLSLITSLIIFIRLTTIWFSTGFGFLMAYFTILKRTKT